MARDPAAERDLHPVSLHEDRAAKRTTAGQADGIAEMDTEVIQSPLQAVPLLDIEHTGLVSRSELIERHDSK